MTMLRTIRLDCVHPGGGEMSLFFPERHTRPAASEQNRLELLGWFVDVNGDDATFDLPGDCEPRRLLRILTDKPWPIISTEALLELLSLPPAELYASRPDLDDTWETTPAGNIASRAVCLARDMGVSLAADIVLKS